MWVRDADPDEAESLGVLAHAKPQPQSRDLNADVSIPADDLDPDVLSSLLESLGSRATLSSGQLHLRGTPRPGAAGREPVERRSEGSPTP